MPTGSGEKKTWCTSNLSQTTACSVLDKKATASEACLATALVGHARLCTKAGCCGGGTPPVFSGNFILSGSMEDSEKNVEQKMSCFDFRMVTHSFISG